MKLTQLYIKNFRAISEATIELGSHTVLIGTNGVGKSCSLKAIDKFFSKSASVDLEDFHDRNTADPIEIGLTFSELEPDELERFASRVHNNELKVVRVFYSNLGNRENGRFYGFAYRHDRFENIRLIEGANDKKTAYNALCDEGGYETLERKTRIDDCLDAMAAWEADNLDQCSLSRDDGQFEGFSNVARGSLQKFVSFVFVPAVRDATADAIDSKSSVIGQLIELLVKTVVQGREDIRRFQNEMDEEYRRLVAPENLGELGGLADSLTETLRMFYGESDVNLSWKALQPLIVPLPSAETMLTEQGYTGPVEGKGHGLQRAFIFTVLQHLALALRADGITSNGTLDTPEEVAVDSPSHSIVIAIEEPELYQHPTKQRHFANVLRELGSSVAHRHASSVQVLLCSHSPHFLATDRFEEVRVVHRRLDSETGQSLSECKSVSYSDVVDQLRAVAENPDRSLDIEGLKARLHTLNPAVAEGFFAKKVVLVEGVSDEAAVRAMASMMGTSLEAHGIALLSVGGKTNLDKPLIIFNLLGIQTYVIFDSDVNKKDSEQKWSANLQLQKICGCNDAQRFRTHVTNNFASFETCLEDVLKQEIGEVFDTHVGRAGYTYGLSHDDVKKSPVPMLAVLNACGKDGRESPTLRQIVEKIFSNE